MNQESIPNGNGGHTSVAPGVLLQGVLLQRDIGSPSYEESGDMALLWAALAKAQGEFQPIQRTRTVRVKTKSGDSYSFDYAELYEVIRKTRPALSANGLCVIQPMHGLEPGKVLTTKLAHSSGASITLRLRVPESDDIQEMGSNLTYLCRYSMSCLLSVSAEGEDDDGNAGNGNQREMAPKGKQNKPPEPTVAPKNAAMSWALKGQILELSKKAGFTVAELRAFASQRDVDLDTATDEGGKVVLTALTELQVKR